LLLPDIPHFCSSVHLLVPTAAPSPDECFCLNPWL
jgi:hypothetical protein